MNISQIIDYLGGGAGALSNAAGTAEKLRDLIRGDDRLPREVSELCLRIYDQLLDAKQVQVRLEGDLRALQQELANLDRFDAEAARYKLQPTERGAFVYFLQEGHSHGEPVHCVCPNCFEGSVKSILQPKGLLLACPRCKAEYADRNSPPQKQRRGPRVTIARR